MGIPKQTRVLVVEDDAAVRSGLAGLLRQAGFAVSLAENGTQGLACLSDAPDLLLVDRLLGDLDGNEVAKFARSLYPSLPIVFLTAKTALPDKLESYANGATAYMTKPFAVAELLAQLQGLLHLVEATAEPEDLQCGDLRLYPMRHLAVVNGREVALTPLEVQILQMLLLKLGKPVGRHQLIAEIWGAEPDFETRTIDNHIARLRQKLDPHQPERWIRTIRGVGYWIETPP